MHDAEKLVFIVETWATTNMARNNGRVPKGERLRLLCLMAIGKRQLLSPVCV